MDLLNSLTPTENSKNLTLKLLAKKADSLEKLEKFADAFLVYETLMKIDSKFSNVQLNYNRVRNLLKETGQLSKILAATSSTPVVAPAEKSAAKPVEIETPVTPSKESLYEESKARGNEFVKQNDFATAIQHYSKCIEIDSVNPVAYLNRSLCYLKCNQAELALRDSSFVLENESKNVKALFRRAMAHKMKLNYEAAVEDLTTLVKLEKNNQIAIQELEGIEKLRKLASSRPTAKKIQIIDEDGDSGMK